jgi:hypothetical protein
MKGPSNLTEAQRQIVRLLLAGYTRAERGCLGMSPKQGFDSAVDRGAFLSFWLPEARRQALRGLQPVAAGSENSPLRMRKRLQRERRCAW